MGEADPKDQDNNNVNNQDSNHEMTGGLQDGAGTTDVTDLGGSFLDNFKFTPKNVVIGAALSPVMGAGLALMASKFARSQGLDVRGETPDDPDGGKFASGSVGNETKPVNTRRVGEEFYGVGGDPTASNWLFESGNTVTPEDERKGYNLALRFRTGFKGKFGDGNFQSFVDADETGNLRTISDNMAEEFNKGIFKGKLEFVDIPMDPGLINSQSGGRLDGNSFAIKHVDSGGNVKFYAPNMSALENAYRDENPDVANQGGNYTTGSDFRRHYEEFGKNEGRSFWKPEIFNFSNVGTPIQRLGQDDTTENPMNPFLNDVTDVFKSYTEGVYEDPRNAGLNKGGVTLKGMMSPAHFADGGEVLSEDTLASTSDIFADGIYSTANLERAIDSPEVVESTESINAPIAFSSEPGKTAYLAYITPEEASSLRQSGQGYSAEGRGQEVLPNLYQHIGPKGLMSFNGGGASGDGPADADTGIGEDPEDKDKDREKDRARERDLAGFEAGLVDEGRNQSGGETQGGPGFSGAHGMSDPSEAGPGGGGNLANSLTESIAHNIIGKYVDALVGLHNYGNKAQEKAREQDIAFDTGVKEGDHAQGFSGRGKGVDIGEPSGVSGAGDNPDDSIVYEVKAPKTTVSARPKVLVPGLGLFSRGGIMGYHDGGDVVDDLGVLHDASTHTHDDENTSPGVNYAPIDYEDYLSKVYGTGLQNPATGGKSPEDWAKSYKDSQLLDKEKTTRRRELADSLNFGRGSVENYNQEGGKEVWMANRQVANALTGKFGLDSEEIASVIHSFRAGHKNILGSTSKFNFAGENEKAIAYLTSLAEGKDAQRKGITQVDIGEGQTNRDVLKKIFANDYSKGAGGIRSTRYDEWETVDDNTAYSMLVNKGDKENAFIKDKYNVDLDAAATVDEVNKFMPVITSGGLNLENKFAGETYEDIVARGDKTPAEHRQGLMSKKTAEEDSRYLEGVGQV